MQYLFSLMLNNKFYILLLTLAMSLSSMVFAQQEYPSDLFRAPVDFRILLSGTFGELRSGHFHSGIDIKTGGVTGKDIHAIGDGYISRVKVSPYGFGNALYITHPQGYVSVYGHLQQFSKELEEWVKQQQYNKESFAVDLPVGQNKFPVRKGDIIAKSGNSGSSGGPHLHFEIRDEATQKPINPLLFGMKAKDFIRPKITGLMVYPESAGSTIDSKSRPVTYSLQGWGPVYRISGDKQISVSGPVSFGISAYDLQNDSHNKNGVYCYEMEVDGELVWQWIAKSVNFSESGYINSLIDYQSYVNNKRRYVRTAVDPNNRLNMYPLKAGRGIVEFTDSGLHKVVLRAIDYAADTSALTLNIINLPANANLVKNIEKDPPTMVFQWDKKNEFSNSQCEISLVDGSLFDDMDFYYHKSSLPADVEGFSELHHLNSHTDISYLRFQLSIKPDYYPEGMEEKLCLAILLDGNVKYSGGEFHNNMVTARTRNFGDYFVSIDTIAPEIKPINMKPTDAQARLRSIKIMIKDEFSGIGSYRATLDDKWVLMAYDAKNSMLTYYPDEHLKKGENRFSLIVTDGKGNEATYSRTIVY